MDISLSVFMLEYFHVNILGHLSFLFKLIKSGCKGTPTFFTFELWTLNNISPFFSYE